MKRRSRWERTPGWQLQGLGTAVMLVVGLALWGAGCSVAAVWHAAAGRLR